MNELSMALVGLNGVILVTVLLNTYRIGRLSSNGGYLKCPFYKGHVNKEATRGKDSSS